jgi:murein tripeptide amidase MpaA
MKPRVTPAAMAALLAFAGLALPGMTFAQPVAQPGQAERFDGHKVVRVTIRDAADFAAMEAVSPDMWTCRPALGPVDYRIPPERWNALVATGLPFEVIIPNVQALIDAESNRINAGLEAPAGVPGGPAIPAWFADYKTFEQMNAYTDDLIAARPTFVSRVNVGLSHQGRQVFAIRIATPNSPADKPGVLLHGVQHAREWITGASTMFMADRLVARYGTDPLVTSVLDRFQIFIVPVVNPDGYAFTWTNNRLWRKTRRQVGTTGNGNPIFGTDPNRNWSFGWGVNIPGFSVGSSGNPSSETYRGPAAFSEPETANIRDFVTARPFMRAHVDIHSYSQLVLSPFGFTNVLPQRAPLFADLNAVFKEGIRSVYGLSYTAGPTFTTIYPAAGVACDWTHGDRGMFGWSMEQRDTGQFGFILPPDQIVPSAEEAMKGILSWLDAIGQPLRITLPDGAPTLVAADQERPFRVVVSNLDATLAPGSALLLARIGNTGDLAAYPLTALGGEEFTATLPAAKCGATIDFAITAAALGTGATITLPQTGLFRATTGAPQPGGSTLVPCTPCPADFSLDGTVNPDDLADYIATFFTVPPGPGADFDQSGSVNPDDLADFIAAYFTPCP